MLALLAVPTAGRQAGSAMLLALLAVHGALPTMPTICAGIFAGSFGPCGFVGHVGHVSAYFQSLAE
jgi:hypothetical protein